MKNLLLMGIALVVCAGCAKEERKANAASVEEVKYVPPFTEAQMDLKVSEIPLATQDDTVSYALGVAWSTNLGHTGIRNISYTFYQGSHDYMMQNKSFVTMATAVERIDKEADYLKQDDGPRPDHNQKIKDIQLATKYDTLNYIWGYTWMRGAKEIGISKITPALILGMSKGVQNDTSLFNYRKADRYLRTYVERIKADKFAVAKSENEAWLAQNKTKENVITLPSGLQYKVIKQGTGKFPQGDDPIMCHYTGKLINGVKFESTNDDGQPLKAYPSAVIKGWREALPLMRAGSLWEVYVPYHLGYGSGGIKDKVPPFATLIYEIELLAVGADVK